MMQDSEEWGPWIEHDGKGCPAECIGKFLLIELRLAAHDEDGGKPGDINYNELFCCEGMAGLPEWYTENFGQIVECNFRGVMYACCEIIRYRIRKPRAMKQINALLQDLPQNVREKEKS